MSSPSQEHIIFLLCLHVGSFQLLPGCTLTRSLRSQSLDVWTSWMLKTQTNTVAHQTLRYELAGENYQELASEKNQRHVKHDYVNKEIALHLIDILRLIFYSPTYPCHFWPWTVFTSLDFSRKRPNAAFDSYSFERPNYCSRHQHVVGRAEASRMLKTQSDWKGVPSQVPTCLFRGGKSCRKQIQKVSTNEGPEFPTEMLPTQHYRNI